MSRRTAYRQILLVILSVLVARVEVTLALEIGRSAPDFTLQGTTGEKISLSQFKGKKHVFIQFYSLDFNPT